MSWYVTGDSEGPDGFSLLGVCSKGWKHTDVMTQKFKLIKNGNPEIWGLATADTTEQDLLGLMDERPFVDTIVIEGI